MGSREGRSERVSHPAGTQVQNYRSHSLQVGLGTWGGGEAVRFVKFVKRNAGESPGGEF